MIDKKPFRDTKLGKFLLGTAPSIVETVGDVLPDRGILGIIKNLIDKDGNMSADDKMEAHRQLVDCLLYTSPSPRD